MEKIDGIIRSSCVGYKDFPAHAGEVVEMKGIIHRIREMTGFAFVIIRHRRAKSCSACILPISPITAWGKRSSKAAR